MQFLFALLTAAAVLVSAQSGSNFDGLISQIPQCAYICLGEAAGSTGCDLNSSIGKVCTDNGAPNPAAAKTATSNGTTPATTDVPSSSQTSDAARLKLQLAIMAIFSALSVAIV
ncbi:hypothetical protein PpBr36_07986 [Pyricularia pennisetigena]|uniref:hypothetical protein n=1 Tax=Pyricularia pennisetigena TaxID=1578925 RepID=UPI0011516EC2|nr:hypothetical protein PpBr36_07986 [Pyricularia pennisetigena]TLS24744.1 hypothetical protein PpBr36_07986 [Pyricularia pennisetigena]